MNYPGRPELVDYQKHSDGFVLRIKLHHPDFMGGLETNLLEYDLYYANAGFRNDSTFSKTIPASNNSEIITEYFLTSKVRTYGISSLYNIYYISVQLSIRDKRLAGIAAVPHRSPKLMVDVLCDLVG